MTRFSNIKAVLFDMDGTLIEHTWQITELTEALFTKFAPQLAPLTCDEFYAAFWSKNVDMWYMMVDGVIDGNTAQVYSYANTLRVLKQDTALAPQMAAYWEALVVKEALPFEDTATVLKTLQESFITGIITNGFSHMQRAKINAHQLDQAVNFCLVSEEVGFHKPDCRIFEQALKQAGNILPEQAVFIGDNLETDIGGALNAGLHPILIDTKNKHTPPAGVPKINCLSQLPALLA